MSKQRASNDAPKRSTGKLNVLHRKNSAEEATVSMPPPQRVVLVMQQHIGSPCIPQVKAGDRVKVGQIIGDNPRPVCAPIHASVSGKVVGISSFIMPSGAKTDAVEIESDGLMEMHESVHPPVVNNTEEFIAAVRACGLVGLGGAGFPAHIKLSIPKDKHVDSLIVNCAECEPFITADYRECMEHADDILDGIAIVQRHLGIKNAFVAIEDNKPKAIELLTRLTKDSKAASVVVLKSRYPAGAEKVLIDAVLGRRIPPGKLPLDVNALVMNVSSIAFLSRYMKTGIPLIDKRVTIDGSAMARPCNVKVPIGTSVGDVLRFAGGYKTEPFKLLMGGPMMGIALHSEATPILKQNNAILALDEQDANLLKETPCIRCGNCALACPMLLQPLTIYKLYKLKDVDGMQAYGAHVCFECGSCAYACPAKIPLVQILRLAKAEIAKNAAKGRASNG